MLPIETSIAVNAALERLSPEQKEAVVVEGVPGVQVRRDGRDSRLPCFSTVKSRLYTALDLLKGVLAPIAARESESL
jgi:RNA polymerase sigma-70 factor (ECF subfamily)